MGRRSPSGSRGGPCRSTKPSHCAIEIAGALDLAHRRGVVHRDLKPANIMLTRRARSCSTSASPRPRNRRRAPPQLRATLTEAGVLLGTPQYMAPEQLEGRAADARADLFAFGAVFYEMLTGRRAFPGESPSQSIAAVLELEAGTAQRDTDAAGARSPRHDVPRKDARRALAERRRPQTAARMDSVEPANRRCAGNDCTAILRWNAGDAVGRRGGAAPVGRRAEPGVGVGAAPHAACAP